MILAITSTGTDLEAEVDSRFGRCQYFIIYDTDTKKFEAIKNEGAGASGGAGTLAAQVMSEKKVETVLTGNIGPNAMTGLNAGNIKVAIGVSGSIKDAIPKFLNKDYKLTDTPSVKSHFGMNK